jgi:hypothetical protein
MLLPLDRLDAILKNQPGNLAIPSSRPISTSQDYHARHPIHLNQPIRKKSRIHMTLRQVMQTTSTLPVVAIEQTGTARRGRLALILGIGWLLLGSAAAWGQATDPDALRVEVEVAGGVHYVGQGFEMGVGVVGAGRRPEVEAPAIAGADVWLIRTDFKPLSVTGIGSMVGQSNVFVSRYRVVPRRAGTLQLPAIRARLRDRTGRSRSARVTVRPVPAEGRPAEFLGGVGPFSLQAEASPRSVRVGKELTYRITVTGPAAWGMTGRPELKRFDRLGIGPRIEPKPVEAMGEPPSRTFVYTLRPTRPGEAVLPPVAIAAFEPETQRYVTHVTPGVPIRVVAVAAFDSATIPDLGSTDDVDARRDAIIAWGAVLGSAVLLLGSAAAIAWVRRRARLAGRIGGPGASRRFAARMARGLAQIGSGDPQELALRVGSALIRYLQLGIGRPPGALTPDEAREGVARLTGSEDLGEQAARVAARCDGVLYRDAPAPPEDPEGLRDDARDLFARCSGM